MEIKVLFVEDEPALAEIVKESLESKGFVVQHSATANDALFHYYSTQPHIIVLDVMLGDGDGFAVAKQIRDTDLNTPIIFLTSRSLPADVVMGFESGGNDYLKKPFSMEELIVRMKALLNKNRFMLKSADDIHEAIRIGNYIFSYLNAELLYSGRKRTLTSRESEILRMLLLNKNRILSREVLLNTIWGQNDYFSGRSLDVFITKLRKYLQDDPSVLIINIRGQGYKLVF
jgi:DNA-binding response OmpR family regulator